MDPRETRAREIQESIRRVLIHEWDPIHVQDVPEAQDEYDRYIGGVYRLLANGASIRDVAEHLATIERESMGSQPERRRFWQSRSASSNSV